MRASPCDPPSRDWRALIFTHVTDEQLVRAELRAFSKRTVRPPCSTSMGETDGLLSSAVLHTYFTRLLTMPIKAVLQLAACAPSPPTYPYIGYYASPGRAVLFTSQRAGVVVIPGSDLYAVGYWSNLWDEELYTRLPEGSSITLTITP